MCAGDYTARLPGTAIDKGIRMLEQLDSIYQRALSELNGIADGDALTEWERRYLGKKGEVTLMLRSTGQLPAEQRATFGQRANTVKNALNDQYIAHAELIRQHELARTLEEGALDVTLPGRVVPTGSLHPTTQTLRMISCDLGGYGLSGLPQP